MTKLASSAITKINPTDSAFIPCMDKKSTSFGNGTTLASDNSNADISDGLP